jgi:glycosyltransferase involved in cell wall biosynthesis
MVSAGAANNRTSIRSFQLKVGFFIPSVGRGGVESSLAKLLRSLNSPDLDLTVLYGTAPPDWLNSIKDVADLVQLDRKPFLPFTKRIFGERASISISLISALKNHLCESDLDVVIGYQSGAIALFARWRAGVDIPVAVRESIVPSIAFKYESSVWSFLKKRVKSFAFSRADAVIAVCKGAADDLIENFDVPENIVEVIYNPAIPENIESLKLEKIYHPWFDESETIPIVVSVGRLNLQKDCPTTLRAIAHLLKKREVRLVMVGDGPFIEELKDLAADLGIEKNVWFAGFQSNPYKFMAKSNVFVLTSIYEGIANVLSEALACGAPVVATDCPTGPTEVLLGGSAGKLVPVGDHAAVSEAIQEFLDDPSLNGTFSDGIAKSLSRFQPEMAAQTYDDLLRRLTS